MVKCKDCKHFQKPNICLECNSLLSKDSRKTDRECESFVDKVIERFLIDGQNAWVW